MANFSLFVKAAHAACAEEVEAIRVALQTSKSDFEEHEWKGLKEFRESVNGRKFNSFYLGAHADGAGFGEQDGPWWTWEDLALAICETDCMAPGGFLFMGCCRGGMKVVAMKIMKTCGKIDYVCGPLWKARGADLIAGFHAFVNSRLRRGDEPNVAAERATGASGQKFCCYDRQDVAGEIEMLRQFDRIEMKQDWLLDRFHEISAEVLKLEERQDRLIRQTASYRTRRRPSR